MYLIITMSLSLQDYDMRLEQRAADWVRRCVFRHQKAGFGENLAFLSSTGPAVPDSVAIYSGLRNWYGERRLWHGGTGHCGASCHYTQVQCEQEVGWGGRQCVGY